MKSPTVSKDRHVPRLSLSRAEVAVSIGVSITSIDVMVKEGALPPPRLWHSRKVWLVSDVEAAIQSWPEHNIDGRSEGDTTVPEEWRAS